VDCALAESVKICSPSLESAGINFGREASGHSGRRITLAHDLTECGIVGHLIAQGHSGIASRVFGVGPKYHFVHQRVPTCNAEIELNWVTIATARRQACAGCQDSGDAGDFDDKLTARCGCGHGELQWVIFVRPLKCARSK
jgi:hypothetical protein